MEAAEGFLRSYSQVFFSSSRLVGAIFLLATATFPKTMAFGAIAVLVAMATTRLLSFSDETERLGLFGYNALLVGLAIGAAFELSWASAGLVVGAAIASVLLTAAVRSLMTIFGLPVLSISFLVVILAVLVATPALGLTYSFADFRLGQPAWGLPAPVSDFLVSLGAIFFAPAPLAGLIVLAGLLVYSRIATLLAVLGYLVALVVGGLVVDIIPMQAQLFLTITMIVVSVALGGIWFVPALSSFVLVAAAGVVASMSAIATYVLLAEVGFPILFLPLNLTIWMMLFAMRQRVRDGAPKSVDFMAGSPEENSSYYRTHIARFSSHYLARFRAPFLGEWVCTQGPDGEITHRGHWKHALDFEVAGTDGKTYEGDGERAQDYHCYGLPVLAPSDATVVRVVDDVEDNPIGQVNLHQNWGNYVLLHHGQGVYSLMAHLQPGKTTVFEGQTVRRGDELGRCGNSGRSPVPHLHFHLQHSPVVGAPTAVTELHDVVVEEDDAPRLVGTFVPDRGQSLRNLAADEQLRAMFAFDQPSLQFVHDDGRLERLDVEVDLSNRRVLASEDDTRLYYDHNGITFTIFDVIGPRRSALHLLRMAIGRVPFEATPDLTWRDYVPLRYALPRWTGWLLDFLSPFLSQSGLEMVYQARREGSEFVVHGASSRTSGGAPFIETRAVLTAEAGLREVEVTIGDDTRRVRRHQQEPDTQYSRERRPEKAAPAYS